MFFLSFNSLASNTMFERVLVLCDVSMTAQPSASFWGETLSIIIILFSQTRSDNLPSVLKMMNYHQIYSGSVNNVHLNIVSLFSIFIFFTGDLLSTLLFLHLHLIAELKQLQRTMVMIMMRSVILQKTEVLIQRNKEMLVKITTI